MSAVSGATDKIGVHCYAVKRLIVNADDFGLTRGVNRAIAEAHNRGVVTSSTMMAGGAELDDAVALAGTLPRLSIGCHVDLIHLTPILPPRQIPTLASGATFRPGFARFARAAFRGRLSSDEITREAAAQMEKLQSAGITLTHFDTHKHTHVFPAVVRALLKAAKMRGIPAVRNPFEPEVVVRLSQLSLRPRMIARYVAVRAFRRMAEKFRRLVESEGLVTTDGTVGIVLTGWLDAKRLHSLIRRIPEGTWELVTHPGYNDGALESLTALTAVRETELALLTSADTRSLLEQCGVELISYRDLLGKAPA